MSDNLPKELRVNPVSIDDVKTLIKEAMAGFTPSGDTEVKVIDSESDELKNITLDKAKEILKDISLGKTVIFYEAGPYYISRLFSNGYEVIYGTWSWEESVKVAYETFDVKGEDATLISNANLELHKNEDDTYSFIVNEL